MEIQKLCQGGLNVDIVLKIILLVLQPSLSSPRSPKKTQSASEVHDVWLSYAASSFEYGRLTNEEQERKSVYFNSTMLIRQMTDEL